MQLIALKKHLSQNAIQSQIKFGTDQTGVYIKGIFGYGTTITTTL